MPFIPDSQFNQKLGFVPDQQPQQQKSLLQRLNTDPVLGSVYEGAAGVDKSVASTIAGVGQLGKNIGNTLGNIPGLSFLKTPDTAPQSQQLKSLQLFSQPSNTAQYVGKAVGDTAQLFAPTGIETAPEKILGSLAPDVAKGSSIGSKLSGIGTRALGVGSDLAAKTAIQTGGDTNSTIGAFLGGSGAGATSKALEVFGSTLGAALQKADFKLSPQQAAKVEQKAESAAQFMVQNSIKGSEGTKYQKLDHLNKSLEETLQNSIPDLRVKKSDIVSDINSSVEALRNTKPAIYSSAKSDAEDAIKALGGKLQNDGTYTFSGGSTLTTQESLQGKRSWGEFAFGQAKKGIVTKDPKVVSDGAYAVEQAYQKAFSDSLNRVGGQVQIPKNLQSYFGGKPSVSIDEFNKVYSNAISARKFTSIAQFKKDSGLVGRLFGLWAGELVGEAVLPGLGGRIIGGATGEVASTRLPGLARRTGESLLRTPRSTIPAFTKTVTGFENANLGSQVQQ